MSQLFRSLSVAEKFFCGLNLHIGTIHLPVGYTEDPFQYSHNALKHVVHIKLIVYQKGDIGEAAHEKRLLCSQKCTRSGVGWGEAV